MDPGCWIILPMQGCPTHLTDQIIKAPQALVRLLSAAHPHIARHRRAHKVLWN